MVIGRRRLEAFARGWHVQRDIIKCWRTSSVGTIVRGQNKIGGRCERQRGVRVRSLRRVETRRKSCMEDGDR